MVDIKLSMPDVYHNPALFDCEYNSMAANVSMGSSLGYACHTFRYFQSMGASTNNSARCSSDICSGEKILYAISPVGRIGPREMEVKLGASDRLAGSVVAISHGTESTLKYCGLICDFVAIIVTCTVI